jgi:hypothetical protein
MLTQITNIWANFARCNSVRVHPYAYPQHMKVLKHFSYIKYGCWEQSVVVYSLNKVIMPSFHSSHAGKNYQHLGQLCQCNSVRVHPYAYPQHIMVLKHIPYIQYGCGKQSVVVYSLNNVIMPSFHSSHAGPNYQSLGQFSQSQNVTGETYMPITVMARMAMAMITIIIAIAIAIAIAISIAITITISIAIAIAIAILPLSLSSSLSL